MAGRAIKFSCVESAGMAEKAGNTRHEVTDTREAGKVLEPSK
jgi:hypothetical protein